MSGISGWVGFRADHGDNETLIGRMGKPLTCFDNSKLHITAGEKGALCAAGMEEGGADTCRRNGMMAAIQGIYRWTDRSLAETAERSGPASALIEGYLKSGAKFIDNLNGRFSLALINESQGHVMLATDRTASEPLFYAVSGPFMAFASTPDALLRHPAVARDIDPQAIYNYLYFHAVPGPGSIYKGHCKLLPGTFAHFTGGSPEVSNYWKISYQESPAKAGLVELKEEFLSILRDSIKNVTAGARTGAFLSGGTDSSTVAGILCETVGSPAPTYSIGFAAEGYDEMEYARIAAAHFQTDHHEYYVTPEDIVDVVPRIAGVYSEPFGNSSAVPTYYCAKLAKDDGITRILAGDGGDELFAGNPHYSRQYIFSIYDAVPRYLRKYLIEPVIMSSIYPNYTVPMKKLRRYVEQAMVPMPERLETYNLLRHLGDVNVIEPEFMEQINRSGPEEIMNSHYYDTDAKTILNRMLWFDYKFVLADKDLPKVSMMCELAGLQVAYPLLSDELIEFSARIPPKLKLKGQNLRYFFKEALREFLPPEVIAKQKHGFGLPVGLWLASHDRFGQLARDNLNDLKSRKIVRPALIDSLLDKRVEEHAPFYGTMVWILMMLEQWFKRHQS